MRIDVVEVVLKIILNIGDIVRIYKNVVVIVGSMRVLLNEINIVVESVIFSIDIRSIK